MSNDQRPRADEEDDLDDLDDVLDQFSPGAPAPPKSPPPSKPITVASTSEEDKMTREEFQKQWDAFLRHPRGEDGADRESDALTPDVEASESQMSELTKEMELFLRHLRGEDPNDPELAAAWEATRVEGGPGPSNNQAPETPALGSKQDDFQSRIRSTMNKLKESESGLKSSDSSASLGGDAIDFESMLSQFGNLQGFSGDSDGAESEEQLQEMMEAMMGQLMSKEVLYEPLKELDDKFPEYLSKNSSGISSQDKERFEEQRSCIKRLLVEFEAPKYSHDNKEVQKKIVDLMGELQSHGSPPEEIMGPLPPGFNMGTDGLPDMPDDCKVN